MKPATDYAARIISSMKRGGIVGGIIRRLTKKETATMPTESHTERFEIIDDYLESMSWCETLEHITEIEWLDAANPARLAIGDHICGGCPAFDDPDFCSRVKKDTEKKKEEAFRSSRSTVEEEDGDDAIPF